MKQTSGSTPWTSQPSDLSAKLRHAPTQARSRERLRRVLDAADEVLAGDGAAAFTTTRVAQVAGVPVGSIYRFFPGKDAIAEALAVRYWSDFEDLVAAVAETDERDPLPDPAGAVLEALGAGFRARPGFLALWYGGLRTERIRDATRPTREAIARSVQRILAVHWPHADDRVARHRGADGRDRRRRAAARGVSRLPRAAIRRCSRRAG